MRLLLLLGALAFAGPAWADCLDTATNDCDGDSFASTDGDCDDEDPDIFPGAHDGCNQVDDDCNGTVDEDCDDPLRDAYIGGGSTCSTAPPGPFLALILGSLLIRRRK